MKIFRTIRQKLASDGKNKRYIIFALVEIVLVVIGILVAVQVNNLHNQNQRNNLERKVLMEILSNLERDLFEIQDDIESYDLIQEIDSILISHLQSRQSFNDTIGEYLHIFGLTPHYNPTKSGYKLLETKGIDLISNDSLRISMTDVYERIYPYYGKYEDERLQIVQTLFIPYLTKNFFLVPSQNWPGNKRIPISHEDILKDPELISLLQSSAYLASIQKSRGLYLQKQVNGLIDQINAFLEQ